MHLPHRLKCRGWNTPAEWKRLGQPELLWYEGSVFPSLADVNCQHASLRGPPPALLPATTALRQGGRSLHWHLLSESRWDVPPDTSWSTAAAAAVPLPVLAGNHLLLLMQSCMLVRCDNYWCSVDRQTDVESSWWRKNIFLIKNVIKCVACCRRHPGGQGGTVAWKLGRLSWRRLWDLQWIWRKQKGESTWE